MDKHKPIFFPGLNGLRAISALAVVASHTTVALGAFNLNPYLLGALPNGNPKGIDLSDFAVSIFFALSGYLITYLLLAENQAGEINIKNFYIRRILRIWPLYYVYYLAASLVIYFWNLTDEYNPVLCYIFFAANVPKVYQMKSDLLGHYWSLGVEEQFYIFWPWIVKRFHKYLGVVCAVLLTVLVAMKLYAHFVYPGSLFESAMYVNRFDCMMIGALGAILYYQKHTLFIRFTKHIAVQALSWLCVILAALNKFHIAAVLDHEFMSGFTVALIIGQIESSRKIINLDYKIFDFLGKLSYGIYVIHPLAVFFAAQWFVPPGNGFLSYALVYACVMGSTILTAYLSYEYLEKWFLKIKLNYSTIISKATRSGA